MLPVVPTWGLRPLLLPGTARCCDRDAVRPFGGYPGAALAEHVVLRVGTIVAVAASHRHGGSRR